MNETPQFQQPVSPAYPPADRQWTAIAALIIGVLCLCAWIFPICGIPLAIVGIILGVLGLKSSQRTLAIVGIVLCALAVILGIINAIVGVMLFPQVQDMFNQMQNQI